jgi:chromosome segregation ATPase
LETQEIIQSGVTALVTGGASFLGAFFRFKQRLKETEESLKRVLTELPKLRAAVSDIKGHYESLAGGWRLEFNGLKSAFELEIKHQRDLAEALKEDRASRPDPLEALHGDLRQLRMEIEKLKERGGRYVRNDVFTTFTKAQEDQWKEMARTLGRLEGMLK